ncbi:MAG: FliM/FliN family flagellar motor switch protein [Congregibacter sp.]
MDTEEDVLTEGEIDALMESVDDADSADDLSDDGEFRKVDFAAREYALLREFTALPSLFERHAELLTSALENAFSLEFTIRSAPAELLPVGDILAEFERVVGLSNTTLAPLVGPVFVVTTTDLLSHVVNAYFGGGSVHAPASEERQLLTPTELRVAERIAGIHLQCLCTAWLDKLPLESGESTTLGVPDRLEMIPLNDLLLRIRFSLVREGVDSNLDLLLPFGELEPFRERFAPPKKKVEEIDQSQSWEPFFRRELPAIELEIAGVLEQQLMTLAELLELAEGVVIPLSPPESVSVLLDDMEIAEGSYGSHEGMKAVQLSSLASMLRASDK